MSNASRLKFAIFMAPYHSPKENPRLALQRDVELIQHAEKLGFEEAWMGEHHSTGWEICPSPEVFLAYAGAKTSTIKLGTGVVSLPYHHPFQVAERITLLDHLTNGRAMLGVGPGVLPHDAAAIGLTSAQLRPRMEESLPVILDLLAGKRVSARTDWFELHDVKLQLPPQRDDFEVTITASASPNGPRLAGQLGISLMSLSAGTHSDLLAQHWAIVQEEATLAGHTVDRSQWRMAGAVHIAETEKQAREDVRYGIAGWAYYMKELVGLPIVPDRGSNDDIIDSFIDAGFAVIGTPDQAVQQIKTLQEKSGGFGTFMAYANDWARRDATFRSYELFARHVMPEFTGNNRALLESQQWAEEHDLKESYSKARAKVTAEYEAMVAARKSEA